MLQPKPIAAPRQFSPSSRDFLTENKTDILAFAAAMRTVLIGASLLLFLGPAWLHVLGLAAGGVVLFRQKVDTGAASNS